jgi:RimJ/RimL family protein N-acetyltransferase
MLANSIETERLLLRPPTEADLDSWAALNADGEATRFIGGVKTRAKSWQGLATVAGMWALRGAGLFSVLERNSGRWIGRVGPWVPEGHIGPEVGWALARESWGRGFAAEAAGAAISWSFEHLCWGEVIHCIDEPNTASIAVAERLGSKWLRHDREGDGKAVEVYGQSRDAWLSSRSRGRG